MAHTRIQIPTLHEMCRDTLNPHIPTISGRNRLNFHDRSSDGVSDQ